MKTWREFKFRMKRHFLQQLKLSVPQLFITCTFKALKKQRGYFLAISKKKEENFSYFFCKKNELIIRV